MSTARPFRSLSAFFAAILFLTGPALAAQEADLAPRLDRLTELMEQRRQELHIPGMALAIVQGDQIIYTHGFGMADLEQQTPVTPETLFAIGSTTKAFTASLVGMLVDEGKMAWDDPVTKYLPYFDLPIDSKDAEASVTIRDLLAHRTGFTRMGILWAGGKQTPEEVLHMAVHAEPWSPFRKTFFYNNVTVMAAGEASAAAAGMSWGELLQQRILTPLGMNNTSSTLAAVEGNPHLSRGYEWKEASQKFERKPMRDLAGIAPAGAMNSNVLDMAQWIRFQLDQGSYAGQVLLSPEQHQETWNPQMPMGGGAFYGLGWMLHPVAGQRVVEHGGNIDGFAAEVGLFPEEDLGFVLLSNVTASPLQSQSLQLVADALFGDLAPEPAAGEAPEPTLAAADLAPYVGRYLADFGSFHDQFFTVSAKEGHLSIDVPGQMDYELKAPEEDGKWFFAMTDQIAISFVREDQGAVIGLKMYQGGMTFELPREGVVQEAEIDLDTLRPYLASYRSEEADLTFEVKILHQRLAVDVPGEMVYQLFPPDDAGQWVFRVTDRTAVSFDQADNGEVTAMTLFRDGKKKATLLRVPGSEPETLPTAAEVLAQWPSQALPVGKALRLKGKILMANAGAEGHNTTVLAADGSYRSDIDFGRLGTMHEAGDATQAWVDSDLQPFEQLEGKYLTQALATRLAPYPGLWSAFFDKITIVDTATIGGQEAYVFQLRIGELPAIRAAVAQSTGEVLAVRQTILNASLGIGIETTLRLEDYREVAGIRLPFKSTVRNDFSGKVVVTVDSAELIETDPSLFLPPKQD